MDFEPKALVASLLISSVGFVMFSYGRKMQRFPQLVAGLALMIYPYFVSSWLAIVGIALAIVLGLWALLNFG